MIGQFDFSEKGWVEGKGRSAVWREIPWAAKTLAPQYLMARAGWLSHRGGRGAALVDRLRVAFMGIGSATNQRTMVASLVRGAPCGNSVGLLDLEEERCLPLVACLNSFVYDFALRLRMGGLNLNFCVIEESPLPTRGAILDVLSPVVARLNLSHPCFGPVCARLGVAGDWALGAAERLRLRVILDAMVAVLYGLTRADYRWILRDTDLPVEWLHSRSRTRTLDPKGFWRIDRDRPPELRHTVLAQVAFADLRACIDAADGDLARGLQAFSGAHGGPGWCLPDGLRLADYGLGRDARSQVVQAVASAV